MQDWYICKLERTWIHPLLIEEGAFSNPAFVKAVQQKLAVMEKEDMT